MSQAFYNSPEWANARKIARRRWRGRACPWCGELLSGKTIVDHIVPIRKGGAKLNQANLCVMHHRCHTLKTRDVDYNDKEPVGLDGLPDSWR